jgi:hypothetical protein
MAYFKAWVKSNAGKASISYKTIMNVKFIREVFAYPELTTMFRLDIFIYVLSWGYQTQ